MDDNTGDVIAKIPPRENRRLSLRRGAKDDVTPAERDRPIAFDYGSSARSPLRDAAVGGARRRATVNVTRAGARNNAKGSTTALEK